MLQSLESRQLTSKLQLELYQEFNLKFKKHIIMANYHVTQKKDKTDGMSRRKARKLQQLPVLKSKLNN